MAGYGCDAVYGLSEDEAMRSMRRKQQSRSFGKIRKRLEKFVEQLHSWCGIGSGRSVSAFNVGEYE